MGTPNPASYLQITPALTSPTFVPLRKFKPASVYRSFDSKSLTDVFLALARACLTLYPKHFLLLKGSSVCSLPEAFPTAVQSSDLRRPDTALFEEMLPALSPTAAPPAHI